MNNKKVFSLIMVVALALSIFGGCKPPNNPDIPGKNDPTYNIVFDYDDAITASKTIKIKQGGNVILPADPIREGYGFKGWYTVKNGGGERITVDTLPASDVTAYARWASYIDMTGRNQIDIGGFNGITEYVDIPMRDPDTNQKLLDADGNVMYYPTKYASEVDFALLQELGVNTIYMTFEHFDLHPTNEHMQKQKRYIEYMNKYNITCWFNDWELNDRMILLSDNLDFNDTAAVASAVAEVQKYTAIYKNEACFKGNYIRDEPSLAQVDDYVKMAKLYKIAMDNQPMYMNLLPNYAADFHLDVTDKIYPGYIKQFIDLYGYSYVSTDNYGINATKSKFGTVTRSVRDGYYWRCFKVIAEAARDNNLTLENHIWTTKDLVNADEKRNYAPTMQDLRFEAANSMAFGASHINLYCASTSPSALKANPEFVGGWGCIHEGKKTPELFDNTQLLVQEIKSLSQVYPKYIWQNAAGYDAGGVYGKALTRDASGSYASKIQRLTSNQDLLIGMFDEANCDGEAFMFVNNCDINNGQNATITFSLSGAISVNSYIGTTNVSLQKNAAGLYTLDLLPGQGVFVTVQK